MQRAMKLLLLILVSAVAFAADPPSDDFGVEVVKMGHIPFRLRLMSYDVPPNLRRPSDITVQIHTIDHGNKTQFLPVGDDIPGTKFTVKSFKQTENPTKDDSQVTITNKQTGVDVILPLKQIKDLGEDYVILRYKGVQSGGQKSDDFPKRSGETFTLPGSDKTYKVLSIYGEGVTIEFPDGSKKTLIPKR